MIDYVIARRWESGELCPYTQYNQDIFSASSLKEAFEHARYISSKEQKEYGVYVLKYVSELDERLNK
jgi:hypothetical protein